MKIPFDIKYRPQIESGEYKVVTGDGQSVTILAFDIHFRGISHKILAKYNECYDYWPINGLYNTYSPSCNLDLFIITPEPELSEFEKAVGLEIFDEPFEEKHIKVIKEESAKLLSIARKELCEQIVDHTKEAYENGKEEALKDLPRWRKANGKERFNERIIVFAHDNDLWCANYAEEGEYYLSFSDLVKLPGLNKTDK